MMMVVVAVFSVGWPSSSSNASDDNDDDDDDGHQIGFN